MSSQRAPNRVTGDLNISVLRGRMQRFVDDHDTRDLRVVEVAPVYSVGNARQPWRIVCTRHAPDGEQTIEAIALVEQEAGQLEAPTDREHLVLEALSTTRVPAPRPLWRDRDGFVFGRPFLATELVTGDAGYGLLRGEPSQEVARATLVHLAEVLAALHELDLASLDLVGCGDDVDAAGVVEKELDSWEATFERHRLEPFPMLVYAFQWLRAHRPPTDRAVLVHGDLRVGNFLSEGGRITALLDWELAHAGDRHEDFAWLFRRMWTPSDVLPFAEFVDVYERHGGGRVSSAALCWHRMFAEVRHSVISLTAVQAFVSGRSTNLRMADRASWVATFMHEFFELERSATS